MFQLLSKINNTTWNFFNAVLPTILISTVVWDGAALSIDDSLGYFFIYTRWNLKLTRCKCYSILIINSIANKLLKF